MDEWEPEELFEYQERELNRLRKLEEAVQEAWDAYDQGHSAKKSIRMVGKALGWA